MLEKTGIPLRGLDAVVVGASNIVGVPMALELLNARATVTVCHSATKDLAQKVSEADLVVVGVGIPNMVKGEWIKDGASWWMWASIVWTTVLYAVMWNTMLPKKRPVGLPRCRAVSGR